MAGSHGCVPADRQPVPPLCSISTQKDRTCKGTLSTSRLCDTVAMILLHTLVAHTVLPQIAWAGVGTADSEASPSKLGEVGVVSRS
jgi:hypothetical protein